jgi:hypothetical protein
MGRAPLYQNRIQKRNKGEAALLAGGVPKGHKQRTVPLCRETRRLQAACLEVRPHMTANRVFIGERGLLTDDGVRAICERYAAICGADFTLHRLPLRFACRYLKQTNNDITGLASTVDRQDR